METPSIPLRQKISAAIIHQIRQGFTPERIALTVAVGFFIAVIPVVGVTTILCLVAAWALRLNQPIIQAINWTSYGLQLVLIVPFIRLGERIFRAPRMTLSLGELVAAFQTDPYGAIVWLWTAIWHAVVAWLIVAPFAAAIIFLAVRPLFRSIASRFGEARTDVRDVV